MIVQSLKGMIKQSKNKNQLLVAPMTIYSATVLCFIMSDITRHVITPCMGVGSVPFLMITYGIGIRYENIQLLLSFNLSIAQDVS